MEEKQIGWILIPPQVMADKRLTQSAKVLYGKINGLTGERGYCWASNETLAEYLGMKDIRNPLEKLIKFQYIKRVLFSKEGNVRHLYPLLPQPQTSVATATDPSVATATATMHYDYAIKKEGDSFHSYEESTRMNKKPRSPREFANARRAELGKPPLHQPPRTEKQDLAVKALKLIELFKKTFYEKHGEGVDTYFGGDSEENGKYIKLAKACVLLLGEDSEQYVRDWIGGLGEFFQYDPSNCWSESQMKKWKVSKKIKQNENIIKPEYL